MKVIALDLEQTLISNAVSQIPRPLLYEFLISCEELAARIVIFTAVPEALFRRIATLLVEEKSAPEWFESVEYIAWEGATKNLNFINMSKDDQAILIDDFEKYVHPGQESNWIKVKPFVAPYSETDSELFRVYQTLHKRLKIYSNENFPNLIEENSYQDVDVTLENWKTAKISYAATELMNGDREAANRWLLTPLSIFGNASPFDHAKSKTGEKDVMNLIGRITHGVFS